MQKFKEKKYPISIILLESQYKFVKSVMKHKNMNLSDVIRMIVNNYAQEEKLRQ